PLRVEVQETDLRSGGPCREAPSPPCPQLSPAPKCLQGRRLIQKPLVNCPGNLAGAHGGGSACPPPTRCGAPPGTAGAIELIFGPRVTRRRRRVWTSRRGARRRGVRGGLCGRRGAGRRSDGWRSPRGGSRCRAGRG